LRAGARRSVRQRTALRNRRTVVVLGIDGAGKTTAAAGVVAAERAAGRRAQLLRNPAGRRWLARRAARWGVALPPAWADRLESAVRTVNVIVAQFRAAGFRGTTVMDRHLACQLVLRDVRGLPRGLVLPWLAARLPEPAAIVLLDVPAALAHARIQARGEDVEPLPYLRAARPAYLAMAEIRGWHVTDGSAGEKEVVGEILGRLDPSPGTQGSGRPLPAAHRLGR
jgi:dTMP kinase